MIVKNNKFRFHINRKDISLEEACAYDWCENIKKMFDF